MFVNKKYRYASLKKYLQYKNPYPLSISSSEVNLGLDKNRLGPDAFALLLRCSHLSIKINY